MNMNFEWNLNPIICIKTNLFSLGVQIFITSGNYIEVRLKFGPLQGCFPVSDMPVRGA